MRYIFNDGGREVAGFKGKTRDCVTRAIVIATELPYREVYDELNALAKQHEREHPRFYKRRKVSSSRTGVGKHIYRPFLESLGWTWVPTMAIGSGCRTHLVADELPAGRLIVRVSKHLTSVVDGILNDTWDCSWTWKEQQMSGNVWKCENCGCHNDTSQCHGCEEQRDDDDTPIKIQGKKCVYGYFQKGD